MVKKCFTNYYFFVLIQGVSQTKTRDSAFRKNDAFSKPIDEYWNEPAPFEQEDYPKMWNPWKQQNMQMWLWTC